MILSPYRKAPLPRTGFRRLPAPFRADRQVVVNGDLKRPAQFRGRRRRENNCIPEADPFPVQRPGRGVLGYGRPAALIRHTGMSAGVRRRCCAVGRPRPG